MALKRPHLMLVVVAPTLLFWLVDALNKGFQRVFIDRYSCIERHFRSKNFVDDVSAKTLSIDSPCIMKGFKYDNETSWPFFFRAIKEEAPALSLAIYYIAMLGLLAVAYATLLSLGIAATTD